MHWLTAICASSDAAGPSRLIVDIQAYRELVAVLAWRDVAMRNKESKQIVV
jgi:hypothetical protein